MAIPPSDAIEALRRVDLFADLEEQEFAALAAALRPKHCDAGQVVVLRGDPETSLYLIRHGQARVVLTSAEGKEVLLTTVGPGDFFGDLALLDGEPRSADVIAQENCEFLILQRSDFMRFLDTHVGVAKHLLAVMARRLRRNADVIEEVAFLDIGTRLARLLVNLSASRGEPREGGLAVQGKLTQTDLANMVGATRESANKWLATYRRQGLLDWREGHLLILDLEQLRERAEP